MTDSRLLNDPEPHAAAAWPQIAAQAAAHREAGRYAEARAILATWRDRNPADAAAHGLLAEILLLEQRPDEAWTEVKAGLELDPAAPDVQRAQARLLLRQGRQDAALAAAEAADAAQPGVPETELVLAVILAAKGQQDRASALIQGLIARGAALAGAHSTRAVMRLRAGDGPGALADATEAVAQKPHLASGWRLLGAIRFQLRDLDRAVEALLEAVERDPTQSEYLMNLAELHKERGDPVAAAEWTDRARALLEAAPDVGQLNLQAAALYDLGRTGQALQTVAKSLALRDTLEGRQLFVEAIKTLRPTQVDPMIRALLKRALSEPWGRPGTLLPVAIHVLRLDPGVEGAVQRARKAWPARLGAADLYGPAGPGLLAGDDLLVEILRGAPVSDLDLEILLTSVRRTLLTAAAEGAAADPAVLAFHANLALQSFINEYVWGTTAEEEAEAEALKARLVAALAAGQRPPDSLVLAVAAYFPLGSLPRAEALLDLDWSAPVAEVVDEQVRAPLRDREAAAGLPRLTRISDEISLRVQDQYEANPYPRWMRLPPEQKPLTIEASLRAMFPRAPLAPIPGGESPDILVAGCGTGQHPIGTARRLIGARVLAVDLSAASLGYARRKSEDMGITGVEYAQADLLELGGIDRSFDLIEASGVLHHMNNPEAGAAVLFSLLRPGGVVGLGLYSEIARGNLEPAKRFIAEHGYGSDAADIRRFRQDVFALPADHPVRGAIGGDFFATSTCRDLLFHVHERQFQVARIKYLLAAHGLTFLGFFVPPDVRAAYRRDFPDDPAATDLDNWGRFELRWPGTFRAMYQFWAQKPA